MFPKSLNYPAFSLVGLLALLSLAPPVAGAGEGGAGAYVAAISRQPW